MPFSPGITLSPRNHSIKEIVPFSDAAAPGDIPVFHHVGVYAYRPAALADYAAWAQGPLETREGLEQLRFLENGRKVRCVEVTATGDFWELNNPSDIAILEDIMARDGTP